MLRCGSGSRQLSESGGKFRMVYYYKAEPSWNCAKWRLGSNRRLGFAAITLRNKCQVKGLHDMGAFMLVSTPVCVDRWISTISTYPDGM